MNSNIGQTVDKTENGIGKKHPAKDAENYADGLFDGFLAGDDIRKNLLLSYMSTSDTADRNELAAVFTEFLKNYAEVPDGKGGMKRDKYYNMKIAAMEKRLASFRTEGGEALFPFALRNNPEFALFLVKKFNDTYDYLNTQEVISFLRYKGLPTNQQRRQLLINGEHIPNVFDAEAVKGFTDENNRFFDFDVKAVLNDLDIEERTVLLRGMILSEAARVFAARLQKGTAAPKHIVAFKRLVANYPDILDMPVNEKGKTAESLVFGLQDKHLKLFFNRAVKMERVKNKGGIQQTYHSGYTISPEEFLIRSLHYGDDKVKMTVAKTADAFTDKKRQRTQIENTAVIAVNNPEYTDIIINVFEMVSNYEEKKRLFPALIKSARGCGATVLARAVCLSLDRQGEKYRNNALEFIEKSFWERSFKGQSKMSAAITERKILQHYGRMR
jgi:hypothetical protein